jgi:hypothetical protein
MEIKMFSRGSLCVVLAIALLSIPLLSAEQPADPPSAPRPAQVLDAKKIYISNAEPVPTPFFGATDRPYDAFYAAMKSWGRYELVFRPADADLVVEIRYVLQGGVGQMRLVIIDPKTHVTLWAFAENIAVAARKATAIKNINSAVAALETDLKNLATPPATPPDTPGK